MDAPVVATPADNANSAAAVRGKQWEWAVAEPTRDKAPANSKDRGKVLGAVSWVANFKARAWDAVKGKAWDAAKGKGRGAGKGAGKAKGAVNSPR